MPRQKKAAQRRTAKPKAPAPQPQAEAPVVAAEPAEAPAPAEKPADSQAAQPPAEPETVRLGHVEGVLQRIPTADVYAVLGESLQARVDALRTRPEALRLQSQVLSTEGRCAPPIFTGEIGKTGLALFDGVDTIAAALNSGLSELYVVTIDAGDAGAVQTHLANRPRPKPENPEDEELLWRVNAFE